VVADRIVLILAGPLEETNRIMVQANLLDRILTGTWLRETPFGWALLGCALLSALGAWLWLALRWWTAAIATVILAVAYVVSAASSAFSVGLLLPLAMPLVAVAVSSAGALLWTQLGSAYRVRHLEGEVTAIREGLVRQESAVEALEEDLEAARAAVARSTGGEEALRASPATRRCSPCSAISKRPPAPPCRS
jgi:hypothetical protein